MAPYLHPLLVQDAPCSHCFGLYTLSGLSRHVKNAHPHANLISQVSQATLSLSLPSPPMLHLGFIPFISCD